MKKSIENFVVRIVETDKGLTGGFGFIRGGRQIDLPSATNGVGCNNDGICSSTNNKDCDNSGNCSATTNVDGCTNSTCIS